MSGFLVRVWCDDCGGGEDPQGCFGGGTEIWGDNRTDGDDAVPFATREAAEDHAHDIIKLKPWSFEIFEAKDA